MPLRGTSGWDETTRFAGTNFKPHKLLENAATPTIMAPALFRGSGAHCIGRALALTTLPLKILNRTSGDVLVHFFSIFILVSHKLPTFIVLFYPFQNRYGANI